MECVTNYINTAVTTIGVLVAWWTLRSNRKSQRESHELLHQPNFQIVDFVTEKQIGQRDTNSDNNSAPKKCCNPDCTKIHWFNIINKEDGFAAIDIRVGLFIIDDRGRIEYDKCNWIARRYLANGDLMQYTLPIDNISFNQHFNHERKKQYRFLLLMDYKSEFSGERYKRAYYIDGASQNGMVQNATSWTNAIYFFGISEYGKTSKKIASKKSRLLSSIHRCLHMDFSADDWLNDFSRKGGKNEQ